MFFAFAPSVNKDVIKIYYPKNVKLFCQYLVDIILKCEWCINQSKKHNPVLEMAIARFEGLFSFVSFFNSHLVIGIGLIKLGEPLSPT